MILLWNKWLNTIDYSLVKDTDSNGATGGINVTLNGTNAVTIALSGGNTNTIQNVSHIIGTGNNDILGEIILIISLMVELVMIQFWNCWK